MEPSCSKDRNHKRKGRFLKRNSTHLKKVVKAAKDIDVPAGPSNGDNEKINISAGHNKRTKSSPHNEQCLEMETKFKDVKTTKTSLDRKQSSNKTERKGKRIPQKMGSKRYSLRSSHEGVRLLRSMSKEKNEKSSMPVSCTANEEIKPKKKKKKKKNKGKKAQSNEFSLIKKRVKYMLTRMNYEQNLLDAYSCDGWKGQSLDKLRPEKELERAKSEILRCKLRIRESFQQLDLLLSEGKFQESLFDSDGQIDSENIFCVKCGLKDSSVDNDIILCDGICDRGFHQKCLNPPLLTEEIPCGDEGWLCPACDCKVDCLDLLTDFLGIDILIQETWESVFPEAAAIANGDNQCNNLEFPSDDSEDDDYNPDIPSVDTDGEKENSSSDESNQSDSTSLSEESAPLNDKVNFDIAALPSDDSDDDDFNPDCSDPSEDIEKEGSNYNESDFTSDSDDFCTQLSKNANDVSVTSLSDTEHVDDRDEERNLADTNAMSSSVAVKRQRVPLKFRKLNDEADGKEYPDSSNDNGWNKNAAAKKVRKNNSVPTSTPTPKAEASSTEYRRRMCSSIKKHKSSDIVEESNVDLSQASHINGSTNRTPDKKSNPVSMGNKGTTSPRRLGESDAQKLLDYFEEDQYPNRETKERLAEELGITFKQVDKWFENKRHSVKVSAKVTGQLGSTVDSSPKEGKHLQTPSSGKTSDQPGRHIDFSAKKTKKKGAQISAKEADQPGTSVGVCAEAKHSENKADDETPLAKSRRRNSLPVRTTAKKLTGKGVNGEISNKKHLRPNEAGSGVNSQVEAEVAIDKNRQKAVTRELRSRRNSR